MLVESIMNTEVITLPPTATIEEALRLLKENKIRHIPIVDKANQVIGIVSDRDVRDAMPSSFLKDADRQELQNEIQTIMTYPVVTVHPLDFVEEIARIFYEKEFACVPVVQNDELVGMVTEKHMLHTFIQLTGTHVQSSQIEVKVPHRPGILPEVAQIIGDHNVNIVSILIYPYGDDPEYKVLVFRVQTMNPMPIIRGIREAGFKLLWPNNIMEPKV
ncbi:acetoin utilization AcuB family protein [Oceanobacillus alkalisoli]|uniref:acetoin utilization AcuB family protein n=1 Tax=Oceanobacillus alkalisoli TaxID=2925113 RepID=UPI001EF0C448|nr:acetoin utilization AcuB family protein [Oceanobacillus alkalisoli]MCF3943295.1 acetoin utilization AcuB family protein [Oceanobacillus alkalisoli]MCG5103828.1 acetoin utilization AcuB family protein [Oceanobacillus alkalisoli]